MILTQSSIRVRYVETDAMGFVHHANYLPWLELARLEMIDTLGLSYREMEKDGFFLPVLGVSIQYKKPAYFDDNITVNCMVKDRPGVRMTIHYEVFRDETLLCTGSTEHAIINREGQPIRPPKHFLDVFAVAINRGD